MLRAIDQLFGVGVTVILDDSDVQGAVENRSPIDNEMSRCVSVRELVCKLSCGSELGFNLKNQEQLPAHTEHAIAGTRRGKNHLSGSPHDNVSTFFTQAGAQIVKRTNLY